MIVPFPIRIYREDKVESIHYCIYSKSKDFREIEFKGNTNFKCFTRSIIKPIQALISKEILGDDLSEEFLAISCSSHQGLDCHIEILKKMSEKFGVLESELLCGIESQSRGRLKSPFYHNCSGKHLAILAASKKMSWSLDEYLNADHPIQRRLRSELERLLERKISDDTIYKDGCNLPTFYLSIKEMSLIFSKVLNEKKYKEILSTMMKFPEIISASGRVDTEIMKRFSGKMVSKGGAEGLLVLLNLHEGSATVLKVLDGSYRAKEAAAFSLSMSTS